MPSKRVVCQRDARVWAQLIPPWAQRAGGIVRRSVARANKSRWPRGVRERMERGCVLLASPIWTAQLTACGSLIMYVTKNHSCAPIGTHDTPERSGTLRTVVHTHSYFAPLHLKKIGREVHRTDPIERSKRDSVGVSIRLIEWPAYRTISSLANNNGHEQHATVILYSSNR